MACGSPREYARWPHEPAGWTVVNDYDMGGVNAGGWTNVYEFSLSHGYLKGVTDTTAPGSGPAVWQFAYPIGYVGGSAPATEYYDIPGRPPALYVGFWWKPSDPWQGHAGGVNKIMFINLGPTRRPTGNLTIQLWGTGSGPFATRMVGENFEDVAYWENVGSTKPLALGVWHRIEILMNSPVGALRWWVDGVLIGSYTGVPYPTSGFGQLQFSPTWGGNGDTKIENDYFWFDHVRVSRP